MHSYTITWLTAQNKLPFTAYGETLFMALQSTFFSFSFFVLKGVYSTVLVIDLFRVAVAYVVCADLFILF